MFPKLVVVLSSDVDETTLTWGTFSEIDFNIFVTCKISSLFGSKMSTCKLSDGSITV